jgi:uncharacterized protein (TIGR00255 family)
MNSMTGYGQASANLSDYKVSIEVSSVNKKNLEVVVNTPKEWQFFEFTATSFLKKKIDRGRVRVLLTVEQQENSQVFSKIIHGEDFNRLIEEIKSFMKTKGENFQLTSELVIELLQVSNKGSGSSDTNQHNDDLLTVLLQATDSMVEMRQTEGKEIASDFGHRLARLSEMIIQIESASKDLPGIMRQKLLEKLQNANLEIDPSDERVLKELALYAEKCDISEEITRLRSHLLQFEQTSKLDGPIGRKLEFILQEISRELNTFCSKSARSQSTSIALEARVEVEKIREQVMNIE